jgi:flagellar biosynthetic protein FliR
VLTPNIETGGPALAQMQALLGTAVFVSLSGHLTLVQGLADSLHAIPPGSALRSFDGGVAIVTQLGSLFGRAVQVAAPAMVALSVTNIAMAILSRAVPQLNAMAMSFAVMIGVGLIMVGVSLPFIASLVSRWTAALPTTLDTMVRSIAPGGGI